MPRYATQAEYYRAHGAAFRLALELGCTPREAETELRRRAAKDREDAALRRIEAKASGHCGEAVRARAPGRDEPWMMRD